MVRKQIEEFKGAYRTLSGRLSEEAALFKRISSAAITAD